MALKFIMKVAAGEYKGQDGSMKTKYQEIGVVMDGRERGSYVFKLTCLPVIPNWDGFGFLAEPERRPQQGSQQRGGGGGNYRQGQNQNYQRRPATGAPESDPDDGLDDVPFSSRATCI